MQSKDGSKVGQKCKSSGYYRCSECDSMQYFDEDDEFDVCMVCGEDTIIWKPEN